ncbi:MAG TPA: hypothetical protein VGA85_03310 [Dehalococcoidales bacterium]
MQDNTTSQVNTGKTQPSIQEQESNQNLLFGIIGGIIAAAIGAIIWALITAWTNFQIGWMAVGVGFLVGFAVRICGKGISIKFGIIGAVLAVLGCLAGNLLAVCIVASKDLGVSLFDVLSVLNFSIIIEIFKETFSPIDLLFYAIAIYEGYRFSFKQMK